MEAKKVLYSKRFPKEIPLDLEKEIEQLNNKKKFDDGLKEGESILTFSKESGQLFLMKKE